MYFYYLRLLLQKFKHFLSKSFCEEGFKDFLYLFLCKKCSRQCDPTLILATMNWTNFKLHYLRMREPKFEQHFLPNTFWDKDFIYIFLCKTWFSYYGSNPSPTTMPMIWIYLNLHHMRMLLQPFEHFLYYNLLRRFSKIPSM